MRVCTYFQYKGPKRNALENETSAVYDRAWVSAVVHVEGIECGKVTGQLVASES